MRIHILGSGAGGGFPQWNCNCPNCQGVRAGSIKAVPRTQSSITLSANGTDWVLFNASPDIRAQLESFPTLQPGRSIRDTAIRAIVLVSPAFHLNQLALQAAGVQGILPAAWHVAALAGVTVLLAGLAAHRIAKTV